MTIARPIFRIFDYQKAIEFYIDWLGFKIDGEHTFGDNFPLYIIISLGDLKIHLTEHHGDCSPGARIHIENFPDLVSYHKQLIAKNYKFNKPGIEKTFWDNKIYQMQVIDPFGNKLTFTGE